MLPIEKRFAELIGKILGKRWFGKGQDRREQHAPRQNHINLNDKGKSN